MTTPDTVWYHLPIAARYATTGSILPLHYLDAGPVTAFYPANSELFHAFGLLVFGQDVASPVLNLGWLALALVAAWAIGQRVRRGAHCVTAAALLLGTPAVVSTQPGGAYNDVVVIALLLSAAAVVICGGLQPGPVALAALAAGLALGTKYTAIVLACALALGAIIASPRGTRRRHLGIWAGGLVLCAGVWYARNALTAGSPLAPLALDLGPLSLTAPRDPQATYSMATDLFKPHIWRAFFIPAFRQAFGPADWAVTALTVAGAVLALTRGRTREIRLLGAVTIAGAIGFLLTPQDLGTPQFPSFFVYQLRFVVAPLTLGIVLLPLAPVFDRQRWGAGLLLILVAAFAATEIDPAVWPTGLHLHPFAQPPGDTDLAVGALLGLATIIAGLAWSLGRRRVQAAPSAGGRLAPAHAGALASAVLAAGGWFVADAYAHDRYASTFPYPQTFRWAQHVRGERFGIGGSFYSQFQYPLYGRDDSNYVQYLGVPQPHAGFGLAPSCRQFRQAVNGGHYQWLVLATASNELRWTVSSSAVVPVLHERARTGELFRVRGRLDPAQCGRD